MRMEKIDDLRSALAFLAEQPGQLVETDVEVDPEACIAMLGQVVRLCALPKKAQL